LKNTQLDRCILHKEIWQKFNAPVSVESQLSVCSTIQQALEIIHDIKDNNSAHINVLFTGSLHLVGSALGLINSSADMKMKSSAEAKRLRS
jgi:folylpolyglutamate synthase/dihydropteroate synthase